jgi:hypothetical protein
MAKRAQSSTGILNQSQMSRRMRRERETHYVAGNGQWVEEGGRVGKIQINYCYPQSITHLPHFISRLIHSVHYLDDNRLHS